MFEGPLNTFEEGAEPIPTPEEIQEIFRQLGVEKYEDVRKLEDEQGLYLWDIRIPEEDAEYSYMRKGHYPEGQASTTVIHVTFFDDSGIPVGGHSVAKLMEGTWELTP
ncbi:MAG: hypothetical protein NUV96_02020 [Candidatus Colwellbacteria bacterium]|nr:hypothetical protein [Candidatus Colwellbacteria bacterium]